MEQKIVKKLEAEIEEVIKGVIAAMGRKQLPHIPNKQTMHLMSKAAVTVYETAVENQAPND